MNELVCYMNEYGLISEREGMAKLWAKAGTQVFVMRPDHMYGDVQEPPRRYVQQVGRGLRDVPGPVLITEWNALYEAELGSSGHSVGTINPVPDDDCAPTPGGVSFPFNSAEW